MHTLISSKLKFDLSQITKMLPSTQIHLKSASQPLSYLFLLDQAAQNHKAQQLDLFTWEISSSVRLIHLSIYFFKKLS